MQTVRHADAAGFHRIWFAEHHLSRSSASHHPELLIAASTTQTSGIRLGSGAGGAVIDMALQRDRQNPAQADHQQQRC